MHDWMGIGLIALGLGLIVSGIMKRRARMRACRPVQFVRNSPQWVR